MACDSKFIIDVNSADEAYEGAHSFGLYSKSDTLVGQNCCKNICSELKHAEQTIVVDNYEHFPVLFATQNIQYDLISSYKNFPTISDFRNMN